MTTNNKLLSTICPSCQTRLHFHRAPKVGDIVVCHECDETLEVVSLSPLKLDWSLLGDDEEWADADIEDYEDRYEWPGGEEWD